MKMLGRCGYWRRCRCCNPPTSNKVLRKREKRQWMREV